MEANPLIKVAVDLMGRPIMEVVVGEEEEHLKTNLYVNFVGEVDMLSKNAIIDLMYPLQELTYVDGKSLEDEPLPSWLFFLKKIGFWKI